MMRLENTDIHIVVSIIVHRAYSTVAGHAWNNYIYQQTFITSPTRLAATQ